MNDKDFDEIGKRLHDLEADPPKEGWSKIGAAINVSTPPGGKLIWLKKHGWKPLVLLIPVFTYLALNDDKSTSALRVASSVSEVTTPDTQGELSASDNLTPTTGGEQKSVTGKESDGSIVEKTEQVEKARQGENARQGETNRLSYDNTTPGNVSGEDHNREKSLTAADNQESGKSETQAFIVSREESTNDTPVEDNPAVTSTLTLSEENRTVIAEPEMDSSLAVITKDTMAIKPVETLQTQEEKKSEEKPAARSFRISFAFTPQYIQNNIRPDANDEVYVNNIGGGKNSISGNVHPGFSLGAGMEVTRNLFVDAHLTHSRMEKNVFYSYATGRIDTLLAVQQSDQSIRIIPVYEEESREIRNRFSFVGLRLGATYYFWETPRRRFNFSAAFGVNYLASSSLAERTSKGGWRRVGGSPVNKTAYSLMVGAGYNLRFGTAWELLINPTLMVNLNDLQTQGVPYSFNQQSMGLNLMISRYLGRK